MIKKLIVIVLLSCFAGQAYAAKGDDLAKEAGNLIRKAENSFFSGKFQEADTTLNQVATPLNALKAEVPEHKSIKTLENKFKRLKERIDEKHPKESPAPKTVSSPAIPRSADASGELKAGAVSTLNNAGKEMDAAAEFLARARESLAENKFNMLDASLYNAESRLTRAKELLERAERSYKVGADHAQVKPSYQRYSELEEKIGATKQDGTARKSQLAADKQKAEEQTAALDEKWLPRIEGFIRPTGADYIDFPMIHDLQRLAEQDRKLEEAKRLWADFEKEVSAGSAGFQLEKAATDLRAAIDNYLSQRNAGVGDMHRAIEDTLTQWEKRFEENKGLPDDSDRSLFIVRPQMVDDLNRQVEKLKAVSPPEAAAFSERLARLEKENSGWVEKRTARENRPRPFPEAKMTSLALEKEMNGLLQDRGWKVKKLVIVDKDWWVLKGEYRYLQAAVLSADSEGPFWSYVNFKQNQSLAGYGPTELWEIKKKSRLK